MSGVASGDGVGFDRRCDILSGRRRLRGEMLAALAREGVENTSLAFLPLFFHDQRTLCAARFSPVSFSDVTSKTLLKSGEKGCLGLWTHTCFVSLIFARTLRRSCVV